MAKTKPDNGATATADKPARVRKSPKDKAETLTVRVINALRRLGEIGVKLPVTNRNEIVMVIEAETHAMVEAWEPEDPDVFKLT